MCAKIFLCIFAVSSICVTQLVANDVVQNVSINDSQELHFQIQYLYTEEVWGNVPPRIYVNNNGVVAGSTAPDKAFVYENGEFSFLTIPYSDRNLVTGINDRNEIVGISMRKDGDHGFLRDGSPMHEIHELNWTNLGDPSPNISANCINNRGEVFGYAVIKIPTDDDYEFESKPFVYSDGQFREITFPNLAGKWVEIDFANDNQIAGSFSDNWYDSYDTWHSFYCRPDENATDVSNLSGTNENCRIENININGDLLLRTESSLFIYSGEEIKSLNNYMTGFPAPPALNKNLEIVGGKNDLSCWIYRNGEWADLSQYIEGFEPGWWFVPYGMNDKRQIVGYLGKKDPKVSTKGSIVLLNPVP